MTKNELNDLYFEWMCQLVCSGKHRSNKTSYQKLLYHLYNVDFQYSIPMDDNRAEDGTDLRYRFGYEHSYDMPMVTSYLDNRPCSMLEMLIALAIRCEEHIMEDSEIGNRTGQWFWDMITNLGLHSMTNSRYDERYTDRVLDRLFNREYEPNGEGGLFTVNNCPHDLRNMEIWYQMCWYLDEFL